MLIHPTPPYWHSEHYARQERDCEMGRYCIDPVKRREETRHRTFFFIEVTFDNYDGLIRAHRELVAAGFEFKIIEEFDFCSTFTEVCRSSCHGLDEEALWAEVQAIVEPFGGLADSGGLIEDPLKEQQLHRLH
jgi:hypothetical protein